MRLSDYVRLSLKNLGRQRVRTFLTIIAVVIGAVSVVMMLSLALGAQRAFVAQVEAMGHLHLVIVEPGIETSTSHRVKLDATMVERLRSLSHVAGASPIMHIGTLHTVELVGGSRRIPMQVHAYEPESGCDPVLVAGRNLRRDDVAKLVVNQTVLTTLGYEGDPQGAVGRLLLVTTHPGYTGWGSEVTGPPPVENNDSYWNALADMVTKFEVEIVGVMASGPTEMFQNLTNLNWGWEINGWRQWFPVGDDQGNMVWTHAIVSEFERRGFEKVLVMVDQVAKVEAVAAAVESLGLDAHTAKDVLEGVAAATAMLSLVLGAIGTVALGVATIGIVNTMIMATYERTREIGVMRACGAARATIRRLFAMEAAVLGFLGGALGLGVSFALALAGNHLINRVAEGHGAMVRNIIMFPAWLTSGVIAFTTILGLSAGLYPAVRAARLNPVEALRYE